MVMNEIYQCPRHTSSESIPYSRVEGIKELVNVIDTCYGSHPCKHLCTVIMEDGRTTDIVLSAHQIVADFWDQLSRNMQLHLQYIDPSLTVKFFPSEEWIAHFKEVKADMLASAEIYAKKIQTEHEKVMDIIREKNIVDMFLQSVKEGYGGTEICKNEWISSFNSKMKKEIEDLCNEKFAEQGLYWENDYNSYRLANLWVQGLFVTLIVTRDFISKTKIYKRSYIDGRIIHKRLKDY